MHLYQNNINLKIDIPYSPPLLDTSRFTSPSLRVYHRQNVWRWLRAFEMYWIYKRSRRFLRNRERAIPEESTAPRSTPLDW